MSHLPAYIDRGGAQTYSQPLELIGCRFYSFVLDADQASLQAVCDRYLNGPAGGRAEYRPLFGCAVLGAAVIDAIRCLDRPPAEQFSITETDVAFWLPVLRGRTVAGVFIAESLQWFLPYVFVNNTWAVASGREIYGFPKAMCDIAVPPANAPDRFEIRTLVVRKFGPDARAETLPLIDITRKSSQGDFLSEAFQTLEEAGRAFLEPLFGERRIVIPGIGLLEEVFNLVRHGTMPMVFLKEFRDVADGSRACYRAVVTAPAEVTRLRQVGRIGHPYQVAIHQYASHPIVRELGLAGRVDPAQNVWTAEVRSAWYVDFDFNLLNGAPVK